MRKVPPGIAIISNLTPFPKSSVNDDWGLIFTLIFAGGLGGFVGGEINWKICFNGF